MSAYEYHHESNIFGLQTLPFYIKIRNAILGKREAIGVATKPMVNGSAGIFDPSARGI